MLQKLGAANILRKEKVPKLFLYPQSGGALHEFFGRGGEPPKVRIMLLLSQPFSSPGL